MCILWRQCDRHKVQETARRVKHMVHSPEDQSPDSSTHISARWTWDLPVTQHLESRSQGFQSRKGSLTSQNKVLLLSGRSCLSVEDEQHSRKMCASTSGFHTRECVHQVNTHTSTFMYITHTHIYIHMFKIKRYTKSVTS